MAWKKITPKKLLLVFIILILPFGQLPGLRIDAEPFLFVLHPLDVMLVIFALCALYKPFSVPFWERRLVAFSAFAAFALLVSWATQSAQSQNAYFYLLRLIALALLPLGVWRLRLDSDEKRFIFELLIFSGVIIALFGWGQYFLYPDLRALKTIGWDDHLFRLVSTFLDPAFTGIMLVCTFLLVLVKSRLKPSKLTFILLVFLILSVGFTYSRASILALLTALLYLGIFHFRTIRIIITVIALIAMVILLPRRGGSGAELERTHSIILKAENARETLAIIDKSPLFGVGYNNICALKEPDFSGLPVHSCSGADNSILYIWATTGLLGLFFFTNAIASIAVSTSKNIYGQSLAASAVAVGVHGMFTNTYFYAWIVVFLGVLVGISRKTIGRN